MTSRTFNALPPDYAAWMLRLIGSDTQGLLSFPGSYPFAAFRRLYRDVLFAGASRELG
jgi:hypothetical protein